MRSRKVMRLRDGTPTDGDFVAALASRFVEHAVAGGHTREEVIVGTARALRRALASPREDVLFLIAEDERGERCGFVYARMERDYFTDEPTVHVEEVAATRSGEAIGSALMDAAEAWARARGAASITLNVVEGNPANRLYDRRGYVLGNLHRVKRLTP